jgi:hypothetical protein
MRIDLETGLFTSEQHGIHCRRGVFYDAEGEQTGDPREAVAFEVELSPGRKLRVPVMAIVPVN